MQGSHTPPTQRPSIEPLPRGQCNGCAVKDFAENSRVALCPEEAERKWFAGLLWKAFPEARSEEQLAILVAEVLTDERRPVHPKTIKNWLRCDHAPHFRYVIRVLAMAGAESLFQIIDPETKA